MLAALVVGAAACGDKNSNLPVAQGSPYEVMFVADREKLDGALGDTIRKIMSEPVEVINSYEPKYNIYTIPPTSFDGLIAKHRNVLIAQTNKQYQKTTMTAEYDVYAKPQIVVKMFAPDNKSLVEYVSEHAKELQAIFEMAERDRSVTNSKNYGTPSLTAEVNKQFGFEMLFPKGYSMRNSIADKNFAWISNEHPLASQGVVIYSYPYSGEKDFTVDALMARRDEFVALIPGENPGSHMITVDMYRPEMKIVRAHGRPWIEMRGFWDLAKDFMGGPFVNYSTYDEANSRIVSIDFFVYSPDKPKRNYLRSLEHLLYGVSFPDDKADEGVGKE